MTSDSEALAEKLARRVKEETGRDVKVRFRREIPEDEERRNEVANRVETILDRVRDLREPLIKRKEERQKRRRAVIEGFFEGLRRSQQDSEKPEKETEETEEEYYSDVPPGMRRTKGGRTIAPEF